LKKHLAEKYPSAVIHSAEAGEIFGGHAMRADTALATLANYNKLWSGERIQTSRSSVVSHIIEEARLTVSLQIQKESLDDFLNKTGQLARGSGFLARFLLSMPESLQGTRLYRPMPEQMPKLEAFHKRLEQILDVEDKFDGERLQPNMMALSPEAHSIWQQFYNQVERELAPNGDLREIADTASKIGDNAARIAALFQYFVDGGDYVQAEHMKGGALIAAWHLHEAQRFFGEMAAPADVENAIMLENWLVERAKESGSNSILFSKARQSGPNRLRRKEAMNEALQELIEAGRAKLSLDRPKQIQVNPALVEVQP
jgi:putative DNA primase/helicase